jgi:hypothetical protein
LLLKTKGVLQNHEEFCNTPDFSRRNDISKQLLISPERAEGL